MTIRSGDQILDNLFTNALKVNLVPSRFERGRLGLLFAVLTAEMVAWETVLENYKKEGFLQQAVIKDDIIKLASPFYSPIPALPSNVILKFYWSSSADSHTDTTIPMGQIAQTVDSTPVQYATTESRILYADEEYVLMRATSLTTGLESMVPAEYITSMPSSLSGIKVINEEESWGGADAEDALSIRNRAITARFNYERGTTSSFEIELAKLGLQPYQYSLVDNAYGYGSLALYVDTTLDEYIEEITSKINEIKASGIYSDVQKVVSIPITISFAIKVVSKSDITPAERDNLKSDITSATTDFITYNGVGQKVVISRLIYYLFQQLKDVYNVFDIVIDTSTYSSMSDSDGNIVIDSNEKLEITNISIDITTS
jgi:hypothetical protein